MGGWEDELGESPLGDWQPLWEGLLAAKVLKCFIFPIIVDKQQPLPSMIAQPTVENSLALPILQYREQIIRTVQAHPVTLICGETGSGKTTQVPQYLFHCFRKIIVSQPRRISAITLAERVASQMGFVTGAEVGYNVRFEEKRSKQTKIVFATDGMAIRQLMIGSSYDLFILDEAHERSINTDVLMAILKRKLGSREKGRGFKLIIMSATIEASKFMRFFGTDALIDIEGRSYPTEMYNLLEPLESYFDGAFNTALQIHFTEQSGDILIFLTGEDEILGLQKKLARAKKDFQILDLEVLMLYSALPHEYQHQIFEKPPQSTARRIILSTNIAETSVTIPGVRFVVDCGHMKIRTYDHQRLLDMLTVVPVSKANARQRAGRAGREAPGKCYQLYPKNAYEQLESYTVPEILRSELSAPILQLKAIGIPAILELEFMDQPPIETFQECLSILREIGALSPEPTEDITDYGRELSKLPLPPRLSHLLLLSLEFKCEAIMLSLMSVLSIDNLFLSTAVSEKGNKKSNLQEVLTRFLPVSSHGVNLSSSRGPASLTSPSGVSLPSSKGPATNRVLTSDHLAKVNLLHEYVRAQNKALFCKQNFVNKNNIKRAVLIRDQLDEYLCQILKDRQKKDFFALGTQSQKPKTAIPEGQLESGLVQAWIKCMAKGCLYATARLGKEGKYKIYRSGQEASIHPESLAFYLPQKPTVIVFSQVVRTSKIYLKDVTPLPEADQPAK